MAGASDAGSFERVLRSQPWLPPPCDQVCWEQVGRGWVFVAAAGSQCVWDEEMSKWQRCCPNESKR